MALFEVPGWSVPSMAPSKSSQKRKRPVNDGEKIQSAEINMDKLMSKFRGDKGADADSPRAHKRRKGPATDAEKKGEGSSRPQRSKGIAEWGLGRKEKTSTSMISGPKKLKGKKEHTKSIDRASSIPNSTRTKSPPAAPVNFTFKAKVPPATPGLTALQNEMKHSLDGARFR
jgi:ribosomal RNA-processing protein 8